MIRTRRLHLFSRCVGSVFAFALIAGGLSVAPIVLTLDMAFAGTCNVNAGPETDYELPSQTNNVVGLDADCIGQPGNSVLVEAGSTVEETVAGVTITDVDNGPMNWQIINRGTIQQTGTNNAILFFDPASVDNAGTISSIVGQAVRMQEGGSVTNRLGGLLRTTSSTAAQITGGAATFINDGTILGTGATSQGLEANAGGTLTNSGTITAARGVNFFGGAAFSIVNTGTITGNGAGAQIQGIRSGGGSALSVTNSGTITSVNGNAIDFSTNFDRLELQPGSTINGDVNGGAGTDTFVLGGVGNGALDISLVSFVGIAAADQYFDFEIFQKEDASTWTLTGINTDIVAFAVNGGTLVVDGAMTVALTTVAAGATLGGSGILGAILANAGGTVAPGNSIGTLTVNGNVTFNLNSILDVEVAANGTSDLIDATGTATINGGTVNVTAIDPATSYTDGQQYTIIDADGGVAGTFDALTENSAFLDFALAYTANQVLLNLSVVADFVSVALTPNQVGAANGLQAFGQTGDALAVFNALAILSAGDARNAFDAVSGEAHASFQNAAFGAADAFTSILGRRAGLYSGGASGLAVRALGYAPGNTPAALPRHAMAVDAPGIAGDPLPLPQTVYSVWAGFIGETGDIDGNANAAQLDHNAFGFATGIDGTFQRVSGLLMAGLSAGYTNGNSDVDARRSSADIGSWHIGAYSAYDNDTFRFSGALTYSMHDIDTTRQIVFPGIARTARAEYDGHTLGLSVEAAWSAITGQTASGSNYAIAPLVTLDVFNTRTDGATETGAAALNLTIASADYSVVDTGIGLSFTHTTMLGNWDINSEARVTWQHSFGDDAPTQSVALAGALATPFTVTGAGRSDDYLAVGFGFSAKVTDALSLSARYGGTYLGNQTNHQGHLALSLNL